ncbi:hypothetical protein I4F81_003608 [Pyropia yezoensis]|uniref:Uncharacterized protein n=1 Tax=Pyropia yezoensis TaxID=2788 RepID=A0ACC3BTI5_PYRYE|nr:hypothetical protein I4F81_003608 [Neopyropia yezoensis]
MARKKVREYTGKQLLLRQLQRLGMAGNLGASFGAGRCAQVAAENLSTSGTPDGFYAALAAAHPWLTTTRLVIKPDMLFGKRGKNNLVLLNADYSAAQAFISARMGTDVEVGGVTGTLSSFVIEPFVPHSAEYYLNIATDRAGDVLRFGAAGGVDIEEHWDSVREVLVRAPDPTSLDGGDEGRSGGSGGGGHDALGGGGHPAVLPTLSASSVEVCAVIPDDDPAIPADHVPVLREFLASCYAVYASLDMTLLEMNPLAVDEAGAPAPLDIRVELDTYAAFKNGKLWGGSTVTGGGSLEFPEPWGRAKCPEETAVDALDENSGASMKLSVLNPAGRIWTMVAGGGASVIYADTVVDMGYGAELGNYAEYSGNPKQNETYMYARTLLSLVTANPDGRRRVLLVGGGVANFTDVAATFTGIIQALKDYHGKLQAARVRVLVRRGGPNYKAGLAMMEEVGRELAISVDVYGPETNMTKIVELGIDWIKGDPAGAPVPAAA